MRILLNEHQRSEYFGSLKTRAAVSWRQVARTLEVNERMLRAWYLGESTIPKGFCDKVKEVYQVEIPSTSRILTDYWHIKDAARKGALARFVKYGNLGTLEGRRKGGLNSLKSPKLKATNFKFRKVIKLPRKSDQLAELAGIMIGDGGITFFQVKVTLWLVKDKDYAFFVKALFEKLFGIRASILETKKDSTIEVVVSSRALVEFLMKCGLPIGNKIRQGIDIPSWIKENLNWSRRCLRGIFDTDGSVYLDRHPGKLGMYRSINVAFTSASPKLLLSVNDILVREGFVPTVTSKGSIRLRRSEEVLKFFKIIGSDNSKHLERFREFLNREEYPSGYKGTVSKTVGVARPT